MLLRPTGQRPGISLLEVLTAIFIMGVGMLALLTLFPLGALSMARAIRDDRAAHIAANAAALASALDFRNDATITNEFTAVTNPNAASHPLLIDPAMVIRFQGQADPPAPPLKYVGRSTSAAPFNSVGIKRVAPGITKSSGSVTQALANRWFTFNDEIEFDTFGGAKQNTTGSINYVNRPGTYTWAYLLRRPRNTNAELAELTVIVYSQRDTDNSDPERVYQVSSGGALSSTSVEIQWSGDRPDLRKGRWILDTTQPTGQPVTGLCYRVENVTDTASDKMMIELDRPIRVAAMKLVTEMPSAIAVVERGTSWKP
ncbi:MAG: hypothetical protein U0840_15580 [Gemmataceae bacterium]